MEILIGGDSWGCGEWGYIDGIYNVLHKGVEQYFKDDDHTVKNTSRGRSSNNESITRMKNEINKKTDFIIWFQSDPLRDCRPNNNKITFSNFQEILQLNDEKLLKNYTDLNDINKKIYIIGGCGKINLKFISEFKNLIPIIPSVPQFLYPDFNHPDIWVSDFIWDDLYNELSNEILENILKRKEIVDSLHFQPFQEYFQPDGRHPNRLGHYRIYEYLKNHCI